MSAKQPGRPSREALLALVDRLGTARVAVAGDAVLDVFEYGVIARVSREAPVLILEHRHSTYVPGGASNTAANLAALDVRTEIIARIGDDADGRELTALLARRGIGVSGLLPDPRYTTPTKTRILAGSPHTAKQQIVRMDRGRRGVELPAPLRSRLLAAARRARRAGAALILADYGYGTVDPRWPAELGAAGGPITLDSRFSLERFRGVSAATPNLEEVERAAGVVLGDDDEPAIEVAARRLRRTLGAEALLVTRGSRGMTLVGARGTPTRIPVFGSDEIADVTGAGDTVIAVFTAARAAGGSWRAAAELANIAGGLVVMKRGTATVSRDELRSALREGWLDA